MPVPTQIPITHRRDGSHTAVFGPLTALTVHRTVIHYRLARLRYVPDCPFLLDDVGLVGFYFAFVSQYKQR